MYKPRFNKRSLKAVLVLIVFAMVTKMAFSADNEKQYKKAIQEIGSKIDKISQNLNANRALLKTEQDELSTVEQKITKMNTQLKHTSARILEQQQFDKALDAKIANFNQSLVADKESLKQLVRQRYRNGNPNYLKMLLNQENPYAVGRLSNYYNYFSKAQQRKLDDIRTSLKEQEQLKQEKQKNILVLEQQHQQLAVQQESLSRAKADRKETVNKLSRKVAKSSDQLDKLKQDRTRLNSLLKQIAVQAAALKKLDRERLAEQKRLEELGQQENDRPAVVRPLVEGGFIRQRGRLQYPVSTAPSVLYGGRLPESGMKSQGIHFKTKQAAQVKAIFRGRVLFADYLKGYGLLLIVDHGDDHISLYGHNDVLYKKVGDMVETSEVVANTGTTGGLKSPGLYFEIRDRATPVDPSKWCQ